MTPLSNDGIILVPVAMFGRCVVSVGPYTGTVNTGKPKDVAGMSDKDRDKAAAWVHKKLDEFGKLDGRTVADIRAKHFNAKS